MHYLRLAGPPHNHNLTRLFLSAGLAALLLPPIAAPVHAQQFVPEEAEHEQRGRTLEMDEAIRRAARQAERQTALATDRQVTFAEVLQDPDNIELNFLYAKTQVAQGDYTGATATLERILMLRPDIHSVRLFLALVYFQLDNLEEAERELAQLDGVELTPEQRRQADEHLAQIRKMRRATRFIASTSVGWGFDTNRNAAPSSKELYFLDTPVGLTGNTRKRRDTHLLVVQSLQVAHDLGTQEGHQFQGSLDYYLGEQTSVDDLDLQSFSATGGLFIVTPWADLSPQATASYLHLSRESYLRSQGLKLQAEREMGLRTRLSTSFGWSREDFLAITENSAAPERKGNRYEANLGATYALMPTMLLGVEFGAEMKSITSRADYNAYEGYEMTFTHTWLLRGGQFLLSSIMLGVEGYDEVDTSISPRRRRDEQFRGRLTYGLPVKLLSREALPKWFSNDLTATISAEQYRALSNITNYTYRNSKIDLLLTKSVAF